MTELREAGIFARKKLEVKYFDSVEAGTSPELKSKINHLALWHILKRKTGGKVKLKELECIYTRWIALELKRQGHPIVNWGTNKYHPQFEVYYFKRTPQFVKDFREIVKRGRPRED